MPIGSNGIWGSILLFTSIRPELTQPFPQLHVSELLEQLLDLSLHWLHVSNIILLYVPANMNKVLSS